MNSPNPSRALALIDPQVTALRHHLEGTSVPIDIVRRMLLAINDDRIQASRAALLADQEAALLEAGSSTSIAKRIEAHTHRETAARGAAMAHVVFRHLMARDPHRHHTHVLAAHPETGRIMCACGLSEAACATIDPDYLSGCCGVPLGMTKPSGLPIDSTSRVYCFSCDGHNQPVIHRDEWQDEVCAGCGRTRAEAGHPRTWAVHYRLPLSSASCDERNHNPLAAQTCSDPCAEKVEEMRGKRSRVLKPIPESVDGYRKHPATRTNAEHEGASAANPEGAPRSTGEQ